MKFFFIIFIAFVLILSGLTAVIYYNLSPTCHSNCQAQVFVVPKGASLNYVLTKLEKEKIIRSVFFAKVYLRITNFQGQIQAGDFKLNPARNFPSILVALQKGTVDFWVTIPEGFRAEQVFERIIKEEGINKNRDIEIYKQNEGYLFPDTYLIPKNASDGNIVNIMKGNFNSKIAPYIQPGSASASGTVIVNRQDIVPMKDVIIIASLVEREAKNDEERPIIAGIIYKRWKANWPLQIDATVQYAVGTPVAWWKKELTFEDLKVESSFNTYLINGLPPSPICSPGLEAIEAVINQKQTDYWFYATGNDGVTRYSTTLNLHNENIDKYINKTP